MKRKLKAWWRSFQWQFSPKWSLSYRKLEDEYPYPSTCYLILGPLQLRWYK